MDEQPIVYRYIGPGWIAHVPARDLTASDVANLWEDDRADLEADGLSGLYEAVAPAKKPKATKEE